MILVISKYLMNKNMLETNKVSPLVKITEQSGLLPVNIV